jgi:hypothetical protein
LTVEKGFGGRGVRTSIRDCSHVVPVISFVVAITYSVGPSSSCERNRRAEISANVTPPRKKTRVTFCSPILEWVEPPDVSARKIQQQNSSNAVT